MEKLKILQVIPRFALAGAEIMCENLCVELKNLGHEVIAVSMFNYHSAITDRLEERGIRVIYLDKKLGFDFSIFRKLYKIYKQEKPDIIHTHLYSIFYSMPAAIFSRSKKRTHTVHSIAKKEMTFCKRFFAKIFYKVNKVIPVALSPLIHKSVVDTYKLKPKKVELVFNGIDFNKCIVKTTYEVEEKLRIIHIGRFHEVKNHQAIIKCAEILKEKNLNFEIELVGQGEILEQVKQSVERLKLNDVVTFAGTMPYVYEKLSKADIFILPSLWEGMPMTLIEAMGTGLPIIASDVGGVSDMLVSGESAYLIAPEAQELADRIIELAENHALREKFGKNAMRDAQRFSSKKMCDGYLAIYNKQIRGKV